jgi:hypothetical protein
MINKIEITIIPHEGQRYPTIGDWQFKGETLQINVSDLQNDKFNALISIHEFIEAMQCHFNGITTEQVDAYDSKHEDVGNADLDANVDAPYYKFHNDSTVVEWLLSRLFNVDWKEYSSKIKNTLEEK